MRPLFRVLPLLGALFAGLRGVELHSAQVPLWVQGTVYLREAKTRKPLSRVYVTAHSLQGRTLAMMRTGRDGRYLLADLPRRRIVLTASRPGYYTHRAAGRSGSRVILDCSSGCATTETDFDLVRGGVISGSVVDKLQEPVERVQVSAWRISSAAASGRADLPRAVTDDRGSFRLAGLRPGIYRLTAQGRAPGSPIEARTIEVKVRESEIVENIAITLGSQATYQVSGVLVGPGFTKGGRTLLKLEDLSGSRPNLTARTAEDGGFRFNAVAEGRYLASATFTKRNSSRRGRQLLGVMEVRGDMEGLILQPVGSGVVTGTIEISSGRVPAQIQLLLSSNEGFGRRQFLVRTAEPRFEVGDLFPGSYRVEARSRQLYVRGVRQGEEIVPADDVAVSPGTNELVIVVAADQSKVYGKIRSPHGSEPLPHARVALDGEAGKLSVLADQRGRFVFERVIPGEYRICAWSDIPVDEVEDETRWEQPGCANKIIPVEPGSQVEIDLRAAP